MTSQAIAETFEHPQGSGYIPVGRTQVSGTREAFVQDILGNDDAAENIASGCPAPGRPAPAACLEGTTMQLLTYINQTKGAIGYAESDALPFFPSVGIIPVNGYGPTRDNVLNGNYTFDATEHLYTRGEPGGLEADVIAFLNSMAASGRLSGTAFIPCQDLGGSKVANACGS
jgi:ABC-type phosphate transport system substrate-binding protein